MGIPAPYYMYHTRHSHPAQRTSSRVHWLRSRRVLAIAVRVRGAVPLGAAGPVSPRRPTWSNLAALVATRGPPYRPTESARLRSRADRRAPVAKMRGPTNREAPAGLGGAVAPRPGPRHLSRPPRDASHGGGVRGEAGDRRGGGAKRHLTSATPAFLSRALIPRKADTVPSR